MPQNRSKMFIAITLSTAIIILVICFEIFYLMAVDQKLPVKADNLSNQNTIIDTFLKNPKTGGVDLSKKLKLEYAKNYSQRELGLMRRDVLCSDCGMLFIFERPENLSFWMKNTLIPLDITFISEGGIVTNTEKATPEPISKEDSQYPTYSATKPALYVLETNQGWTEKNNLKSGDKIDLSKILPDK